MGSLALVVVAVCVPVKKLVHTDFMFSFLKLLEVFRKKNVEFKLYFDNNWFIDKARSNLAKCAIEANVDYVLWLDSDLKFEYYDFVKFWDWFLEKDLEIATGVYYMKAHPYQPALFKTFKESDDGEENFTFITYPSEPFEVDRMGFGLVLMKNSLLRQVYALADGLAFQSTPLCSEDFFFCRVVRDELKLPIWAFPDFVAEHEGIGKWHYQKGLEDELLPFNELSDWTGFELNKVLDKCMKATYTVRDNWNKANPKTSDEIYNYYINDRDYLYELVWFWKENARERNKYLSLVERVKPKRVLDFGCGIGDYSLEILKMFPNVSVDCIDINDACIQYLMWRLNQKNINPKNIDVVTYPNGKYDLILLLDVLEHLPNPKEKVDLLKQHLNKGGFVIAKVGEVMQNVPHHISSDFKLEDCGFVRVSECLYQLRGD